MNPSPSITRGDPPRSFVVMPSHDQALRRIADDLLQQCPAQLVLVVERSGYLLCAAGGGGSRDLAALASLVAGDLSATQELARRTGQVPAGMTLREGPTTNSFLAGAGEDLGIFVQVSSEIPLGWVRLLIQESLRLLMEVLAATEADVENLDFNLSKDRLAAWFDDAIGALPAG